jgi:hypothetical protein
MSSISGPLNHPVAAGRAVVPQAQRPRRLGARPPELDERRLLDRELDDRLGEMLRLGDRLGLGREVDRLGEMLRLGVRLGLGR